MLLQYIQFDRATHSAYSHWIFGRQNELTISSNSCSSALCQRENPRLKSMRLEESYNTLVLRQSDDAMLCPRVNQTLCYDELETNKGCEVEVGDD